MLIFRGVYGISTQIAYPVLGRQIKCFHCRSNRHLLRFGKYWFLEEPLVALMFSQLMPSSSITNFFQIALHKVFTIMIMISTWLGIALFFMNELFDQTSWKVRSFDSLHEWEKQRTPNSFFNCYGWWTRISSTIPAATRPIALVKPLTLKKENFYGKILNIFHRSLTDCGSDWWPKKLMASRWCHVHIDDATS